MPVFIELTTDPFLDTFYDQVNIATSGGDGSAGISTSGAGSRVVRRPMRGLEIKEDTHAILKLVGADGRAAHMLDSSASDGASQEYSNFVLQSVSEARMEKHQIVETFGESYIYFFGESPRFLDVTALLINSHDFNWEAEWWENYDTLWRGTRSVEMGARLYMFYDDTIVEGYMLQAQASKDSMKPLEVMIQYRLFVTNVHNVTFVGEPEYPVRASVSLPPGVELTSPNAGEQIVLKYDADVIASVTQQTNVQLAEAVSSAQRRGFGAGRKISELIRNSGTSVAISPNAYADLTRLQVGSGADKSFAETLQGYIVHKGKPLRSKIADNWDEYTGTAAERARSGGGKVPQAVLDVVEGDDLHREAIQWLDPFGADIDSIGALNDLGLSVPKRAERTTNLGDAGPVSDNSFTPQPSSGVGFSEGQEAEGLPANDEFTRHASNPLNSVYGSASASASASGSASGSASARFNVSGVADAEYGYSSEFSDGPGYGHAGYGDMGGKGYGSCNSSGDPGFRDPSEFTYAGVSLHAEAFARFKTPKHDTTALTEGGGVGQGSGASAMVGASVKITGRPSAFAMTAVAGTLRAKGSGSSEMRRSNSGCAITPACPNPNGVLVPRAPLSSGLSSGFEIYAAATISARPTHE